MPDLAYFQMDSTGDPILGVARNGSKAPLWIVRGTQPELKAWRDGYG
jgi:hypothetical protein